MTSLEDQLVQYATYHRDERNIATHVVGIPLIMFAVAALLSRPAFALGGGVLTPAMALALAIGLYYLRLSLGLGLLMAGVLAGVVWLGLWAAAQPTGAWLAWGLGTFLIGWAFQGAGHLFEGRKPAFIDDLIGLLIGPLFLAVELLGALGACRDLRRAVEARAGAVRGGHAAPPR